jgi:hypothetical protein
VLLFRLGDQGDEITVELVDGLISRIFRLLALFL